MTALAMLIAGDVNTVDTFTGVVHPFTLIPIFAPIADSQTRILIYGSQQLESETMATVVNPVSLEVTAVRGYVGVIRALEKARTGLCRIHVHGLGQAGSLLYTCRGSLDGSPSSVSRRDK